MDLRSPPAVAPRLNRGFSDFLVEGILGTRRGDTNLDGNVDFGDFLILANAYGSPVNSWGQGDFNGDGDVGFDDFLFLASNFGYKRALGALTITP